MTTIAYRDGVLALDSQVTSGNLKCADGKYTIHGNTLLAITGDTAYGWAVIKWLEGDREKDFPIANDDASNPDVVQFDLETGEVGVWTRPGVLVAVGDRIAAWGSGAGLAIGAMAAGAKPEEAVEIAAAWDIYTGFDVEVFVAAAKEGRKR